MVLSKSKSTRDLVHFRGREMKRGRSVDAITLMAAPWGEASTVGQPRGARSQTQRLPIMYLLENPYFFGDEI